MTVLAPVGRGAPAAALLLVATCGSPSPPLVVSCRARVGWTGAATVSCRTCFSEATRPRCDCDTSPAAGACIDQRRAVLASSDCTKEVTECRTLCGSDCACQDGCYAAHATCRALEQDLQACIVRTCDERCR